jgi:hypothetical protein
MFFISVDSKEFANCVSRLVSTLTGRYRSVDSKWLRGNRKKKKTRDRTGGKELKPSSLERWRV